LLNTSNAPAQGTEGDAILGAWLTEDGKAAVEIYRCDSEYCGSIYDTDNGKTYSCKMTLDNDTLKVRGFVGISLFGRTTVWKRKR
jgi:uncharacterized protein (DUF2147 family)